MSDPTASDNSANAARFRFGVASLIFAITFTGLFLATDYSLLKDGDTYWHVATGRWIIDKLQIPHIDPFTYTFAGEVWLAKEWLSQVLLYGAYSIAGWKGVNAFTLLLIATTIAILNWVCLKNFRFSIAIGATALIAVFASIHYLARPHMVAYPIMMLWTIGLVAAANKREVPSFWLLPLILVWANLHGGFTLGLLIAGFMSLETLLATAHDQRRTALFQHGRFLLLAGLAALATPFGLESILITPKIFGLGEVLDRVSEWKSPDFHVHEYHLIILVSLLGLALYGGFKLNTARLGVLLVFVFLMFKHRRALPVFGLLAPVLLAKPLREQFPILTSEVETSTVGDDPVIGFLLRNSRMLPLAAAGVLSAGLVLAVVSKDFDGTAAISNPIGAVEFARDTSITGNVFNDYDYGGYLIFSQIPTYIDGRAELFGRDFFNDYYAATWQLPGNELFKLLDESQVSWTLFRPQAGAAAALDLSADWQCVFEDDVAVLHVRVNDTGTKGALEAATQNACKRNQAQ